MKTLRTGVASEMPPHSSIWTQKHRPERCCQHGYRAEYRHKQCLQKLYIVENNNSIMVKSENDSHLVMSGSL